MRKFLVVALLTVALVLLAEKVTITFMTPLSGADGAYMDEVIKKFNATHPDIEVTHLVVGSSVEYKQKLSTGVATKTAPHVLLIRKFDMPLYLDHFRTFTKEELLTYGINIDDIYPAVIEGLIRDGKIYGIPLDVWIFYMAYNKSNFEKAGLDPNKAPYTREEFEAAMEALKKITPAGATPWCESPTWSWIFVHLLWQFGGDLLTPDFKKPAFKDAAVQTLKNIMTLQDKGYLPKALIDPGPTFESGAGTILITGIWTINPWRDLFGEKFGYAVAPQLGTTKAVFGGSHVLAMPKVMVEDSKVFQAAMSWIRFLWDNSIDWYAAGQTPARKSIAESEELKKRLPHIYTVAQQLPYVKTFQLFPYISEVLDEIAVYLEDVLITRKLTPEKAMEMAEQAVQDILDDYWATAGKKK